MLQYETPTISVLGNTHRQPAGEVAALTRLLLLPLVVTGDVQKDSANVGVSIRKCARSVSGSVKKCI